MSESIPTQDRSWMFNHPELGQDEVFVGNATTDPDEIERQRDEYEADQERAKQYAEREGREEYEEAPFKSDWEVFGWETKRLGNTAYDKDGNVIEEMRPVFVKRSEMEAAGIDLNRQTPYTHEEITNLENRMFGLNNSGGSGASKQES